MFCVFDFLNFKITNTNQAIAKPQATLVIGNGISNNK